MTSLSDAEAAPAAPSRWAPRLLSPQLGGSLALLAVILAAWEWGPPLLGVPAFIVPPFSEVLAEAQWLTARGGLWEATFATAWLVVAGFVLGSLLGAAIGYLLGMSPTAEIMLSPYLLALQIAPKVAFAPLFVLWFGYNFAPKLLVAVLIVFFPVLVNVLAAVRAIEQPQIDLARSFRASRLQIFWMIEFPASMPALFAGLRIGATLAVIGVVVGEFVGGNTGLGFLLTFAQGQANTPAVFVAIINLTLIGILLYLAVVALERRVLHYQTRRAVEAG
jgi:NitT/TauT family transport system permease protein